MKRLEHLLTVSFFAALLLSPWVAGALGVRPTTVENRQLQSFPTIGPHNLLDNEMYSTLGEFIEDHLPMRQWAASTLNSAIVGVTGMSPSTEMFLGPDGTMYLAEDVRSPCDVEYDPALLNERFQQWESSDPVGQLDVVLAIAPDKSSIHRHLLSDRQKDASVCQQRREEEFADSLGEAGSMIPLRKRLVDLHNRSSMAHTHYTFDSHWTFWGAAEFAEALVDRWAPGVFDPAAITSIDEYEVRADIARRLGWDRREIRNELSSDRPGVSTDLIETDTGGTRTVRSYKSTTDGSSFLIPGNTVVLHDSMMNFAEAMVVPYFESIEFVHWNDRNAGGFFDKVARADRVVVESVQRNVHERTAKILLGETFHQSMSAAIGSGNVDALLDDINLWREVVSESTTDTIRPTIEDIAAPTPRNHPTFGDWRLIDGVVKNEPGSLGPCEYAKTQCGIWVLLTDVDVGTATAVDRVIDGANGLGIGDIRYSSSGILYAWVRE